MGATGDPRSSWLWQVSGEMSLPALLNDGVRQQHGLLREHSLGSASFTLGLPVSRRRLMAARIGMGALQASTLAIIPSVNHCQDAPLL